VSGNLASRAIDAVTLGPVSRRRGVMARADYTQTPNRRPRNTDWLQEKSNGCPSPAIVYNPMGWWDRQVSPPKWGIQIHWTQTALPFELGLKTIQTRNGDHM
jgi:hypothetical protein